VNRNVVPVGRDVVPLNEDAIFQKRTSKNGLAEARAQPNPVGCERGESMNARLETAHVARALSVFVFVLVACSGKHSIGSGCSDGTQEGFRNVPGVAGCGATWPAGSMRAPPTGAACGNGKGPCAVPADACAPQWHVCGIPPYGPTDISSHLTQAECMAETAGDYATGVGDQTCDPCDPVNPGAGAACCGSHCLLQGGSCVWPGQTPWFGVIAGHVNLCGDIENAASAFGVLCCEDAGGTGSGDAATRD
jgi:hypothetical protein